MACVISVVVSGAIASTEDPRHQQLVLQTKARFLDTFARYVDWPKETFTTSRNALVIGVLGEDPFGKLLDATLENRKFNQQPIQCARFQRVEDVRACQVLFIAEPDPSRLKQILVRLRGKNILTVSDADGFLDQGGQIQFVLDERRLKFEVNLDAVRKAGLDLDANLLRAARRVVRHDEPAGVK